MKAEEIKEILDDIDMVMINNLNKQHMLVNENIINEISLKITQAQQGILENQNVIDKELQTRFNVTAQALMAAKDKSTRSPEDVADANKYYKWIDNAKENASKKEITFKEALKASEVAVDSGHELNAKAREVLDNSYIFGNGKSISNLPKKQTIWDKIKSKFLSLFTKDRSNSIPITSNQSTNTVNSQNFQKNSQQKPNIKIDYKQEKFKSQQPLEPEKIVISDIHGNLEKWNCVKQALKENPKRKLIIEGDAMDRGPYGVEILMQIKDLCDKGKAEYLPGNHDVFAYNTLRTQGTKYENNSSVESDRKTWERNGGKITMQAFENFDNIMQRELQSGNISKPISKQALIAWLGNCPIQKTEYANGKNYALSHAMFDEKLYIQDPEFNLEKALVLQLAGKENSETYKRFNNCMWYRENDENTHFSKLAWPSKHIVVCGHTRQTEANMQYIENDPNKAIVYLDCGNGLLQGFNISKGKHIQIEYRNNTIENDKIH